ncbi:sensor histidine kinase [Vallitalea maricola]
MEIFFTVLSVTLTQIPGLILRYIPFSKLFTQKQKKQLLNCYILFFIFQFTVLYIIALRISLTPSIYRIAVPLGAVIYLCINCIILKNMFFQHAFVYGMQGSYCLVLHSFVAILLSHFAPHLTINKQIMSQSFLFLLLFVVTAYPLWHFIKDSFYLKISAEYNYHWKLVWLIPNLLWLSTVITTMNNNWISSSVQLIARIIMGLTIFILWKCVNLDFKQLEEKFALKSTNQLLHIQMNAISHQATTIHENDEKIQILRHDFRHNIQMLSTLIAREELADASLILKKLNDDLENTKPIIFCKNPVINSALLVYINKAQKQNIEIISEIDIPQNIPWSSNDIALLFANVLENAINASSQQPKEQRKICITTRYDDNKLAIIVENYFFGEILFNDNGMPISLKQGHGVGMRSITSIVSKYRGHVVCSHTHDWFTISFMFSNRYASN